MKQFLYYDRGEIILEAEYLNGKENGKIKAIIIMIKKCLKVII